MTTLWNLLTQPRTTSHLRLLQVQASQTCSRHVRASRIFPFHVTDLKLVKHVPAWFPGAGWKRKALLCRSELEAVCDIPFEFTKQYMVVWSQHISSGLVVLTTPLTQKTGEAMDNFVAMNLKEATDNGHESILKDTAASMYAGTLEWPKLVYR